MNTNFRVGTLNSVGRVYANQIFLLGLRWFEDEARVTDGSEEHRWIVASINVLKGIIRAWYFVVGSHVMEKLLIFQHNRILFTHFNEILHTHNYV